MEPVVRMSFLLRRLSIFRVSHSLLTLNAVKSLTPLLPKALTLQRCDVFNNSVLHVRHFSQETFAISPEKEMRLFGKVITVQCPSLRFDKAVRKGLNLSQLEFEKAFYSRAFSVNGQPLLKKSTPLIVGDMLDMVIKQDGDKTFGKRVIVLESVPKGNAYEVTMRCFRRIHQLNIDPDEL